jgi:glycosyltransferase involved in cell wall biosynthesis
MKIDKPFFTLIVATKGRLEEVGCLLGSVAKVKYDKNLIQLIIVDQNAEGFLDSIIEEHADINILHIRSDISGLSFNRNIGLRYAEGDIICFPDDDCLFYEDSFAQVSRVLDDSNLDFCVGRIYDRNNGKNVIKKWPKSSFNVGKFNSYFINSSITMFFRKSVVLDFDENLGVGAAYGSCEDADFLYRIVQSGAAGVYTPAIEVWHPDVSIQDIPLDKVRKYASGFGYFIRKDLDFTKVILLILLIIKKILQLVVGLLNGRYKRGYFKSFFGGLLDGFFKKVNVK